MLIRYFIIVITSALICISIVSCTDSTKTTGKEFGADIHTVEVHSNTLVRWAQAGIRDAVVINIDAHDDIRVNEQQQFSELRELMKQKEWEGFARVNTLADDGLYNVGNFLYAAAKLGIVKEVYWIIPFPLFRDSNAEAMLKYMLRFSSFGDDVIKTFSMKNGCYSGSYEGIPLTICGIEKLPDINEPVILSIDVDFFPEYARTYYLKMTDGVTALFNAVNQEKYNIIDTVVSYSISGGFLKPRHRWVGELVEEVVLKPKLIPVSIPERFSLLQQVEEVVGKGRFAEALRLIDSVRTKTDEVALNIYRAEAMLANGELEGALSSALDSCSEERLYCYELPYLGMVLADEGRAADAVRFFSPGYAINPDMDSGQAEYGIALEALGRYRDALAAFEEYRALQGSFPIDLMITAAYIRAGETAQALERLRSLLLLMKTVINTNSVARPLAEAILTIVDFCRANGYSEELAALENSQIAQVHRKKYPSVFER